ncbi:hypothetical protein [Pseudomonas sp. TH31]|uniref:hypothetical protein n=1 Tax=Pseudomonas sp. TH31 TaxID=2796396 RepID=UPI0019128EF4|nr:hypothetical protein [Pseudomonas sp. TH31]MBK5414191.1 hypothetical protein [Pseudomonas sp. TH31]
MNSPLLLSNVIALVLLLGFQFAPESDTAMVTQRMPHYLQLQKAPQLAVMSDLQGAATQEASQRRYPLPAQSSERLVF